MPYFMKLAMGSDHAGFDLKEKLKNWLQGKGYQLADFGTDSQDSCDYPDFSHPVSAGVELGQYDYGIILCGSANGTCMTANKHQGIRAALCWIPEIARLARAHNNANVLCIPARFVEKEDAQTITETFLSTSFEGGRHENRVAKIPVK